MFSQILLLALASSSLAATPAVWFTERPDANFHHFMSSMMDSQVEGALGGNAFRQFVMTVDYGHARAWFRCVHRPGGDDTGAASATTNPTASPCVFRLPNAYTKAM